MSEENNDNNMSMNPQSKKTEYKVTQVMLLLRTIIGGYLLYLVYSLVENYLDGNGLPLVVLIIISVLFGVIGLILAAFSLKALIMGEYQGGKADDNVV